MLFRSTDSQLLCGLLPNASLFFEIDEPKGMILEYGRCARDVLREDIELLISWGPKTREPNF
jgi:hypothetical protein